MIKTILSSFLLLQMAISPGRAPSSASGFSIANNGFIQNVPTSVTSAALSAFSNPLTPGSLIVVHQYSATGTYSVPTDTAGNTYVDCGPGQGVYDGVDTMECFYALNTHSTASNIVTIHSSSVVFLTGLAFEVLGAASSSPLDGGSGVGYSIKVNASGGAAGSNNLTAISLTPAGSGDLIVALFSALNGSTAGTSPNAFSLVNGTWTQASQYFLQTASAAIVATASDSHSSDPFAVIVIAIKP